MRIDNAQFTGSATGTQATANLTGSFTGSGHIDRANTASRLEFSASFGLGIENTFNYNGSSNQNISIDTASVHFIEGVHSASIDAAETGSFIVSMSAASASSGQLLLEKGDGTFISQSVIAASVVNTLAAGDGIDAFSYNGSITQTVGIATGSARFIEGVSKQTGSLVRTISIVGSQFTASKGDGTETRLTITDALTASYVDSSSIQGPLGVDSVTSASHAVTASYFAGNIAGGSTLDNTVVISGSAISGSTINGSTVQSSSIDSSTITNTTIDGSTITNTTASSIQATGSFKGDLDGNAATATRVNNALSNGLGVDTFTFDGSATAQVQVDTSSAHFTTGVSASQASTITSLSASLTTTDQTISASSAALSGSASTARDQIKVDYLAATASLSASLTTTDQTISSSVAALSSSASTARDAISSSISNFVATQFVSESVYAVQTGSFIVNAVTAALQEEDQITFTKGDGTTFPLKFYTGSYVKSVNLATPDATGNVAIALASVQSGTSASMLAASSSNSLNEGDVWVIAGETGGGQFGSASNGITYIYAAGPPGTLFEIASLTEIAADAKYVNVSGDTMTGDLVLPNDPTLAAQAARKNYVDLFYDSSSLKTSTAQLELHKGNGTIDIKSFAGISVSSSVSASHLSQADNVAIRSTTGPTENFIYLKKGTGNIEVAARDNIILNMDTNAGGVGTIDFQLNGTSVADINQAGTGSFAWVNATASVANRVRHDLTNGLGVDAFTYDGVAAAQVQVDTSSAHFTTGASASVASIITANSASSAAQVTNFSSSVASTYVIAAGGPSYTVNISASSVTGSTVSASTYIGGNYTGGTYNYTAGTYDYTGGTYSYTGGTYSYTGGTYDYTGVTVTSGVGSVFNISGSLVGTASFAGTASGLHPGATIATSGEVVGTATNFDGSGPISIPTTIANDTISSRMLGTEFSTVTTTTAPGATFNLNFTSSAVWDVTANAGTTTFTITNQHVGDVKTIIFDGNGQTGIALPGTVKVVGGNNAAAIDMTAGKKNAISILCYDDTTPAFVATINNEI